MTIKAIKEAYKNYRTVGNERNSFVTYDYNDGNGKVVIVVNICKGYGDTVVQIVRVSDGAELLKNGECRPCDNLEDAIDVAGEMFPAETAVEETEEPSVGDVVEICGVKSIVTSVENYGFFVKGRDGIVLYSDDYKIIRDAIVEVSRPKLTWTYLYTETTTYNVDMDIYRTEDGRLVMVDSDWMF